MENSATLPDFCTISICPCKIEIINIIDDTNDNTKYTIAIIVTNPFILLKFSL